MEGTFGEVRGAKSVGLLPYAQDNLKAPCNVLLLMDTGGARG